MGSPCIGNISRYEKVAAGISMRGEFHPAKSTGGVLIAGGYRGHYHRPEFGEASVVPYYTCSFGYEIGDRIHMVDTGSYNRICYSPEKSSEKTNTVHGNAKSVLCASGDSEAGVRGSTGWNLDRPCVPPTFRRQGFMTPFTEAKPA